MSTLVIGGTGEIGSAVVRELATRGLPFHATYASTPPPTKLKTHFLPLTFTDLTAAKLADLLKAKNIFVVVNCAVVPHGAKEDEDKVLAGIVDSTVEIAKACEECKAVLIQLSTDLVFDGDEGNYTEVSDAKPKMFYGECKLMMEKRLQARRNLRCLILRTSLVLTLEPDLEELLGRNRYRSKALLFCMNRINDLTSQGRPAEFFDDEVRSMTFSHDLASAITSMVALGERKLEELVSECSLLHFTAPTSITRYDLASKLLEYYEGQITNVEKIDVVPGSSKLLFKGKRPLDCSFSTAKYQELSQKFLLPKLRPALEVLDSEISARLLKKSDNN